MKSTITHTLIFEFWWWNCTTLSFLPHSFLPLVVESDHQYAWCSILYSKDGKRECVWEDGWILWICGYKHHRDTCTHTWFSVCLFASKKWKNTSASTAGTQSVYSQTDIFKGTFFQAINMHVWEWSGVWNDRVCVTAGKEHTVLYESPSFHSIPLHSDWESVKSVFQNSSTACSNSFYNSAGMEIRLAASGDPVVADVLIHTHWTEEE